jgi:uncharacterized protein YndB with AHSA1/START domain
MSIAPVRKEIVIEASQARAFRVFTEEHGAWWPLATHHIGEKAAETAIIEPRAGGRWFERGEDGSECDWGKVLAWEPPRRLLLSWQLNGNFQVDPNLVTEVEVTFMPEGANLTRVELEHRYLERAGDTAAALRAGVDSPDGWAGLLKRFAEAAGGLAH